MSLLAAKPKLEKSILDAFEKVLTTAKNAKENDVSATIRKELAKDIASAIDEYVKSATVNISTVTSTVPPGVTVATVGSPSAQTGATTSPGIAKHAGFGTLQ